MALFSLARRLVRGRPLRQRLFSSAAAAPSNLPFSSAFSDAKADSLRTHGYAVLDECFGSELSAGARAEILELHEAELLYPNTTHVIEPLSVGESKAPSAQANSSVAPPPSATFVEKHNVFEIEAGALFRECGPEIVPRLHDIDALSSKYLLPAFQSALSGASGVQLDAAHAIKCQVNTGARGCFPMHVDADSQYSSRVLSSILYLNPEWRPSDGGELILYPFPFDRVVVRPTLDRMVSFSSTAMLHRVLPSKATSRACLTVWHSRAAQKPSAPSSSRAQNVPPMPVHPTEKADEAVFRDQVLAYLLHPRHRLHVARLFYAAEWKTSIYEAHHESPERARLLAAHARDVDRLRKYFAAYTDFIENEFPIREPEEQKRILEKHGHLLQWF